MRLVLASLCALTITAGGRAESDPLDLARGLRDIGSPDLALEYLADLEKKKPSTGVMLVLPLERAKSRLAIAQLESDQSAREVGVTQAKKEFEAFLAANPKHPRAAEATLAMAQVTAAQAINALNDAFKVKAPTPEERRKKRTEAAVATRPIFINASTLFGNAAKAIDAQLKDAGVDAGRKAELAKAIMQAELDRGINLFRLVDTYIDPQGPAVKERADYLDQAQAVFKKLGQSDKEGVSPVAWQARAWVGACEMEKQNRAGAEKIFKEIKADAARSSAAAAADGLRMVEYFEAYAAFDNAVSSKERNQFQMARGTVKTWLDKDRYRPRMTPQRLSMTYYYAFLTEQLGLSEVVYEKLAKADEDAGKKPKIRTISSQGYAYLKEAAREYKKLLDFDNEYSERAGDNRNRAVRFVVGDKVRPPKDYADLEECQMAGFVQLLAAGEAKSKTAELADEAEANEDAKKKWEAAKKAEREEYAKAIALMERARSLVTPQTLPKDAADARLNLIFAYYYADQFPLAAITGEAMARGTKGSAGAKAGLLGVDSYLKARERLPDDADETVRAADRDRAVELGLYMEKAFPTDSSTDSVRLRLGQLLYGEKQYQAAFDLLSKVAPSFADVAVARAIEARAAYILINSKESPLTAQQKKAIFDKAVKDCEAVAEPAGGPTVKAYYSLRNMLANLHLSTKTPAGNDTAEKITAKALTDIAKATIPAGEKPPLQFAADEVHLRAIYAGAAKLLDESKYKEMVAKMTPALASLAKSGPAAADPKLEADAKNAAVSLDAFRRSFIILAMNGRLREGEFDKSAELFELLEKLGGSTEATTSALNSFVAMVRPQLEALKKDKKTEEAAKLSTSVGTLLVKQAEKPKLPARVQATLGRNLRDLGQYDKAIDVLKKVPAPPDDKLKGKLGEMEEADRDMVVAYQIAQMELARSHRLKKSFDEADKVLKAAMGDDKVKGWAKSVEFRREAVLLLEDKAEAAPEAGRLKAWGEAKAGWERIASDYAGIVRNKELPENEREKFVPTYLECLCDLRRCLVRANTQLLAAKPADLAKFLDKTAQQVLDVETSPSNAKALNAQVKAKFGDLLNDYPALKAEYVKKGGKAFVEPAN